MKRILSTTLAALALLLSVPTAKAWTYSDGDALLIFHKSNKSDVEFDLGNISQFTNVTSGTTITVTGWNLNLVTNTFTANLTDVSVVVAATTDKSAASQLSWLSGSSDSTAVYQVTPSSWQFNFWSVINALGTRPVIYQVPATNSNTYIIDPSGSYAIASYDTIVTSGQSTAPLAQFGGHAAFTVDGVAPTSFGLWQIAPTLTIPKPPAKYLGTFTITAAGALTYTAGPPAPSAAISRTAGVNTVSFPTVAGASYWLTYTNDVKSSSTNWPVVAGPLTGDGDSDSLSHTTSGSVGFYGVKATP